MSELDKLATRTWDEMMEIPRTHKSEIAIIRAALDEARQEDRAEHERTLDCLAAAADESDKMRAEIERWHKLWLERGQEIGRLANEASEHANRARVAEKRFSEQQAEIERLREDNAALQKARQEDGTVYQEQKAEIERLRAEVISWTASAGEQRTRAEAAEKRADENWSKALVEADRALTAEGRLEAAEARVAEAQERLNGMEQGRSSTEIRKTVLLASPKVDSNNTRSLAEALAIANENGEESEALRVEQLGELLTCQAALTAERAKLAEAQDALEIARNTVNNLSLANEAALTAERAKLAEAQAAECHHGWRGEAIKDQIATPCPSCGLKSLFIGSSGHLTCANLSSCKSPAVESALAAGREQSRKLRRHVICAGCGLDFVHHAKLANDSPRDPNYPERECGHWIFDGDVSGFLAALSDEPEEKASEPSCKCDCSIYGSSPTCACSCHRAAKASEPRCTRCSYPLFRRGDVLFCGTENCSAFDVAVAKAREEKA